jgi:hypothetical protein
MVPEADGVMPAILLLPRPIVSSPPHPTAGDGMSDATTTVILLLLVLILYLLPTVIAFGREHPSRSTLALLNIALGWTLIGWIAVFLWALMAETESEPV